MLYGFEGLTLCTEQQILFRDSEVIALSPKAISILTILVERAGTVVSRETLREQVWGDAVVEDASLTRNISVLRSALSPYVGESEIIETLSKRGYRFTAPVTNLGESRPPVIPDATESATSNMAAAGLASEALDPVLSSPLPVPAPKLPASQLSGLLGKMRRLSLPYAAFASLLVLVVAVAAWQTDRRHRSSGAAAESVPSRGVSVAIVDLHDPAGVAGSAWIGVAVRESLADDLARAGGADVASGAAVFSARRDLGLTRAQLLTAPDLTAFGRRMAVRYVLTGTVMPLNQSVRLDFHLMDAATGNNVREWTDTVSQPELAAAVNRAATVLRVAMHLPAAQDAGESTLLARDSTALSLYAQGITLMQADEHRDQAADVLRRASEADPKSTEIRAALASALGRAGDSAEARQQATIVLNELKPMPEAEQLPLKAAVTYAMGDYGRAADLYGELLGGAPGNRGYTLARIDALTRGHQMVEARAAIVEAEARDASWADDPDFLMATVRLDVANRDLRAAVVNAGKAFKMAEQRGSRTGAAAALRASGVAWGGLGHPGEALKDLHEAERIFRETGNTILVLAAQADIESVLSDQGDPGLAAAAGQTLAEARAADAPFFIVSSLQLLGNSSFNSGHLQAALAYFQEASAVATRANLRSMEVSPLSNAASVNLALGDFAKAAEENDAMLRLAATFQDQASLAFGKLTNCALQLLAGHPETAEGDARAAVEIYRHNGLITRLPAAQLLLVKSLLARGAVAEARAVYREVDPSVDAKFARPAWELQGAKLLLAEGDAPGAERLAAAAAAEPVRPGMAAPGHTAEALEVLGRSQLAQGREASATATAAQLRAFAARENETGRPEPLAMLASGRLEARVALAAGRHNDPAITRLPALVQEARKAGLPAEAERVARVQAEYAEGGSHRGEAAAAVLAAHR